MSFIVVIPARYASSRLPAKPLVDIAGQTMLERVYRQALQSQAERVVIATDHEAIFNAACNFGAEVLMTREDHASGTDRLAEVAQQLELRAEAILVNVQGDEPLIPPAVINQVAANLALYTEASVATVSEPVVSAETYLNPNAVKVVSDHRGLALYFSRAPIPWDRESLSSLDAEAMYSCSLPKGTAVQKHVGIYAYRAGLLAEFVEWPMALMESIEKLEQLRVLANGHRIHVELACEPVPTGVDTQADLERIRALFTGSNS